MSESLRKEFTEGTHRWLRPEETLTRIAPHLGPVGITRAADVTGLDRINIPVFCSMRPQGRILQISNGKGATHAAAEASALMEAIELHHAENPPDDMRRDSALGILQSGGPLLGAAALDVGDVSAFFSETYKVDWVMGEELLSRQPTWLMACSAYICEPSVFNWTSNGLASGNHLVEATLHAIYELVERDSFAWLAQSGASTRDIDPSTVDAPGIADLIERVRSAGLLVTLIHAPSRFPSLHTFWAAIIEPQAFAPATRVVAGSGTHLSPEVAASRALTEAAQGRLGLIHASREDVTGLYVERFPGWMLEMFATGPGGADWRELEDFSSEDLGADLDRVLGELRSGGLRYVFRIDMTRPELDIPVARVMVPGLDLDKRLLHH